MIWKTQQFDESHILEISRTLGVSDVLARLLLQRGLDTKSAAAFLRPSLSDLADPFSLCHLEAAVIRISQSIEAKENVVVLGDYDVDGITSTVQMVSCLQGFGLEPRFFVPRRMDEGYGLSMEAIERVLEAGQPDLFIVLDCGTNAHEPIAHLVQLGVDVIVVDHHQAKYGAPADCLLINPHAIQSDASDRLRDLCTAGLVFKLIHGLIRYRRGQLNDAMAERVQMKDFLDLVALGTVADLVPLCDENRILSWFGLHHLKARKRPGIRALIEISGITADQDLSGADLSFRLGPRINASGRLADASRPVELLLSHEEKRCKSIAAELDAINRERQDIEREISRKAEERAGREFADAPGILLYDPDWHLGVVGIVASRVSRRFNKPTLILGADGDQVRGSGRSIDGVNLVEVFSQCDDLLGHWGGHPMAVGVSTEADQISTLTSRFIEVLRTSNPDGLPEASLEISAWLDAGQLSSALLAELDMLHPFGRNNPEPVFGICGVVLEEPPRSFGNGNFRFHLPDGSLQGLVGVAWKMDSVPPHGQALDFAFRFNRNFWRGKSTPQITLLDWRPAK